MSWEPPEQLELIPLEKLPRLWPQIGEQVKVRRHTNGTITEIMPAVVVASSPMSNVVCVTAFVNHGTGVMRMENLSFDESDLPAARLTWMR